MTRDNNETRKKANAVFFSVIMVLSMVAVGFAGFAGSAAAANQDADNVDITYDFPTDGAAIVEGATDVEPSVTVTNDGDNNLDTVGDTLLFEVDDNQDGDFDGIEEQPVSALDSGASEEITFDDGAASSAIESLTDDADHRVVLLESTGGPIAEDGDGDEYVSDTLTLNVQDEGYVPTNPFQGQDVTFLNNTIEDGQEYDLRRVTDSDAGDVTNSQFVDTITADQDNQLTIETDGLDADDYFVRGHDLEQRPSLDDTFEVRVPSLDADFDDDTVADTGGDALTDLEIDSNRGTYTLNVSADGDLDEEDLLHILTDGEFDIDDVDQNDRATFSDIDDGNTASFETYGDFNVVLYEDGEDDSDLDSDEKVALYQINDREHQTNFTDIDDGEYEFLFEGIDTDAEDTASITVEDVADAELSFVDSTVDVRQGGVAGITVEANDAADSGVLVIGEEDDFGYQMNVTIEEFNEETDEITIYFNTYLAGTTDKGADVEAGDLVWVDEDDADEDAEISFDADSNTYDGGEHSDTGDLEFILSQGDYDLQVLAEDDYYDAVDSPDDVGTLIVDAREQSEMNVWTASSDTLDDIDDVDDVVAGIEAGNVTDRDLVAQEDVIIHEMGADTGLDGIFQYIARTDAELADLIDSSSSPNTLFGTVDNQNADGESDRAARLRVRETRDSAGPNVERRVLEDLDDNVDFVIDDGASDVFLVIETDNWDQDGTFSTGSGLESDEDYEFNSNFRLEDSWMLEYDPDEDDELGDIFEQTDSTYDVEERQGEFDQDPYNATNDEGQEFIAHTNIAPGSEVNMRVRSTGDTRPAFIRTESDIEVTQDERVIGEYDLSDTNVGDTYDVTLRGGNFDDDVEASGEIVEQIETDTPTPEPEPEPEPTPEPEPEDTPEPEPEPEDTPEPEPEPEPTDDDTPGFGAVVALIALIAAALLATRRRP